MGRSDGRREVRSSLGVSSTVGTRTPTVEGGVSTLPDRSGVPPGNRNCGGLTSTEELYGTLREGRERVPPLTPNLPRPETNCLWVGPKVRRLGSTRPPPPPTVRPSTPNRLPSRPSKNPEVFKPYPSASTRCEGRTLGGRETRTVWTVRVHPESWSGKYRGPLASTPGGDSSTPPSGPAPEVYFPVSAGTIETTRSGPQGPAEVMDLLVSRREKRWGWGWARGGRGRLRGNGTFYIMSRVIHGPDVFRDVPWELSS